MELKVPLGRVHGAGAKSTAERGTMELKGQLGRVPGAKRTA